MSNLAWKSGADWFGEFETDQLNQDSNMKKNPSYAAGRKFSHRGERVCVFLEEKKAMSK